MSVKYFAILSVILSCQFLNGAAEEEGKRKNLLPDSEWILPNAESASQALSKGDFQDFSDRFLQGSLALEELVITREGQEPKAMAKDLIELYCTQHCEPETVRIVNLSQVRGLAMIYRGLARIRAMGMTANPADCLDSIVAAFLRARPKVD